MTHKQFYLHEMLFYLRINKCENLTDNIQIIAYLLQFKLLVQLIIYFIYSCLRIKIHGICFTHNLKINIAAMPFLNDKSVCRLIQDHSRFAAIFSIQATLQIQLIGPFS